MSSSSTRMMSKRLSSGPESETLSATESWLLYVPFRFLGFIAPKTVVLHGCGDGVVINYGSAKLVRNS